MIKRIAVSLSAVAFAALFALPASAADAAVHQGQGTVNRVDPVAGKVNMTHGPILSLKWPGMTMDFTVKDKQVLKAVRPGQKVEFKLSEQSKGEYVISEIVPAK